MSDDQFHLGRGNWWDSTRNSRGVDDAGTAPPPSVSARLNAIANYDWPTDMVDMKSRSAIDPGAASGASAASGGGVLATPNLQMMGLGLSNSQGMDWNPAMFRGEKSESSYRSMLQEDSNTSCNFLQDSSGSAAISNSHEHWPRHRLYTGASSEDSAANDFKQMNRGFTLDHQSQFSSQANSNDSTITSGGYQHVDSAAAYGLLMSENQPHNYDNIRSMNYTYPPTGNYGHNPGELMPSWNKFPQFLRTSPPKHPQPLPSGASGSTSHLQFTNNTPFWNASATMNDARSGFFPALQTQIPMAPSFDEKPKNTLEVRDSVTTTKKNNTESSSNKRARNEMPSPLPACNKVRKEKMGDRITALQQLVSPFGKTDTASVLSEAIEYIKFLHEQVSVLSTPYMKNGAPVQRQQISDKSKDPEGPRQDLRSRGLCLVPISSTFPVTQETTVDFWTPTFGGTFR
ncbi:transcription factor bHLH123 [Henckelia pumila]|uniref:transcription factor bHLH123 n=1 Tax=Henckelia pumila TaxID=405737 RepID=UPI003C6E5121